MSKHHLKHKEKQDKKQRILEAAIMVFATQGFRNSAVADVAKAASVATGTVYLYFENKADLFIQTMQNVVGRQLQEIKNAISGEDSALERLYRFIDMNVVLFTTNREVLKFMVLEWRQCEEFYKTHPAFKPLDEYLVFVTELCAAAVDSGEIRRVNPRSLAYIIVGSMDFVLTRWLEENEPADLELISKEIASVLRHGLKLP